VRVGKAVGVSGGGGVSGSVMAEARLRVLALATDAFGGHGGIAQYNRDLLSSLARSDLITCVTVLPRRTERPVRDLPLRLRQLRPVNGRLAYSLAALAAARAHRPIHVVFCGHVFMTPLAIVIAKLFHARLWIQVHGVDAWQELSGVYRRSIEAATLITSVSRDTRRRLLQWNGIDPARVKVLPNTVDSRFCSGPKPGHLINRHALHGKKVLMTVSRLAAVDRYKGHDRVIRNLSRVLVEHPEVIYLIVGDGDDRPRLEALATECGVAERVRFVGPVRAEELPDYFRLADVFVMPSTGEGFGIVFLEAMASGIQVIGGNQDGSLDALGDGILGTAVNPYDCEEIALAISAALRNPARTRNSIDRFKGSLFAEHLDRLVRSNLTAPDHNQRRYAITDEH
jgi:phosphatidyl-myo-inositol dimannoside synthase